MPFTALSIRNVQTRLGALLLALFACATVTAAPVHAQPLPLSPGAYQALDKAQALLQESKWSEADAVLRRCIERSGCEPYAAALAWQMLGYLLSETGQHEEALRAYDKALELRSLDVHSARQALYNSAQLLMALGRPDEAVQRIDDWLARSEAVPPEQRVQAAWIYLGARKYETASLHMEEAVRAVESPLEAWYQLLLAALQGAENHAALKEWLPVVIERFPREKRYWQQLAVLYFHQKDDQRAAAALAAAYHNGLLTDPSEILQVAQLYLGVGLPHKAARILQQALEKGEMSGTAAHYELLADSWLRARETDRAIDALRQALAADAGPETSLKLGQILIQREEWSAAREYLERAARSPKERTSAEAALLLGMAAYHSGDTEAARSAFAQARRHSAARRQADTWLAFLNASSSGT